MHKLLLDFVAPDINSQTSSFVTVSYISKYTIMNWYYSLIVITTQSLSFIKILAHGSYARFKQQVIKES